MSINFTRRKAQAKGMNVDLHGAQCMDLICAVLIVILLIMMIIIVPTTGSSSYGDIACYLLVAMSVIRSNTLSLSCEDIIASLSTLLLAEANFGNF